MKTPDAERYWSRLRDDVAPAPRRLRHLFEPASVRRGSTIIIVNKGPSLCTVAAAPDPDVDPDSEVCPECAALSRKVKAVI